MFATKNVACFRGLVAKNFENLCSGNKHTPSNTIRACPAKPSMSPRTFRSASETPSKVNTNGNVKGFSSLIKPSLFTILAGGTTYVVASIWQYENLFRSHPRHSHLFSSSSSSSSSSFSSSSLWRGEGVKTGELRQQINVWWNRLSAGEKSVAVIMAINGAVFLLWRIPAMHSFMCRFFTASPMAATSCLPMLLSTFSHHSSWHLAANLYVLWSFAPSITRLLGNEQFVATYLTAGLVSSLGSYIFKVFNKSTTPSIGASGAIMAVLGAVCVKNPDARLSVAFVSSIYPHSFSADSALKCLILLDSLGILLRWKLFDHAAHLAGVLFGVWYVTHGSRLLWQKREPLVRRWHQWRSGKQ